jgi:hypothetical protein
MLKQAGDDMEPPSVCAHCGRYFGPNQVLIGFTPCRCGGHMYAYCREDAGGCGETTYDPPVSDETCRRVSFGYEGTT